VAEVGKISAFIRLIRPINCVMMGFAVIVGAALAGKETFFQQLQSLLFGFSTGFFLTAAAMTINDYYDREIDAINEPKRPIPSGAVSAKEALVFAFLLTAIGLASALATAVAPNWQCLTIASVSWVIVISYVTKGKSTGLPGNLLVSTCIAVPFIYGSFVVGKGFLPSTSLFVAMVFLANTGREITKGIVDCCGGLWSAKGSGCCCYILSFCSFFNPSAVAFRNCSLLVPSLCCFNGYGANFSVYFASLKSFKRKR